MNDEDRLVTVREILSTLFDPQCMDLVLEALKKFEAKVRAEENDTYEKKNGRLGIGPID